MQGKRIVLMANGWVGLKVAEHLAANGDDIVRLYTHEPEYQDLSQEIIAASHCDSVFKASLLKDDEHVATLRELAPDFIITVYWRHLLSQDVIDSARNTVNFHPALLPVNRGWYPHVHSIVDGSPCGVTLHALELAADTGPIWCQKEVPLESTDTAKTIYVGLQQEMVNLFKDNWQAISDGSMTPVPQDENKAVYHSIKEVDAMDHIDLDVSMSARELINILRARSFGDLGFAYYIDDDGNKVHLNLRLGTEKRFNTDKG